MLQNQKIGKFDKSVQIWVNAALRKMGCEALVDKLKWRWNPKLTSTIGKAYMLPLRNFLGREDWWCPKYIELSPELFERAPASERRNTVYHEIAHIVDGYEGSYNEHRPHGKSWKAIMARTDVPAVRCHDIPVIRRR